MYLAGDNYCSNQVSLGRSPESRTAKGVKNMKSALKKIMAALKRLVKEYDESQLEIYNWRTKYLINNELVDIPKHK